MFNLNISITSGHKDVRFDELRGKVLQYARLNVRDKTYSSYCHITDNLFKFLGNKKIANITKTDLQNYIATRKKVICNKTGKIYSLYSLNIEIAVIKKTFSIAEEEDWIQKNPAKQIKKFRVKSEVKAFENSQLNLFLNVLENKTKNIHYFYAVKLALLTGMRKGEICSLKWNQIDYGNMKIGLNNKITKETEYVYFNSETLAILNELRKSNIISSEGYIWGKRLNERNLSRTFNYWRDKLGLPCKIRFHSTRHTAITRWANSLPFHVAQDLARHHSPVMTKRYIHTREEQLKKAIGEDRI